MLAVLLLGLGTADAVWLNLELLPRALRSTSSDRQQDPGVAVASAAAAPVPAAPEGQPTPPSIAEEELEDEVIVVEEDEASSPSDTSYDALQESLRVVGPIRFATGRTDVSGPGERQLRSAAELLGRAPDLRLEVRGHADQKGDAALNRRLARARAVAVQRALVDLGVAPERIAITSAGTREPMLHGNDAESLAANRRVELQLLEPPGPQ